MLALFFIIFAFIIRIAPYTEALNFIPHLPNFTPIAAIALFSGVYLKKEYALGLPLLVLIISDIIIGFYSPFIMISVYGSFLLIGLIGFHLKNNKNLINIGISTLTGSIIFFLITNFAVWAVPNSFYPHTLQGLLSCYTMGLPFFKNTVTGDIFYVTGLFGLYELINYLYFRRVACRVRSMN